MPYASHVCKLSLWLLCNPLPVNTFHCTWWQTVNVRIAETKWLSFVMFMNYMHLNDHFFFLRWVKADSKVDFESSVNPLSV